MELMDMMRARQRAVQDNLIMGVGGNDDLEKARGKKAPVGTISNGMQKQPDGTWKPVKKTGSKTGAKEFKQARLEAGYWSIKEKDLSDQIIDLESSSDPEVRDYAKPLKKKQSEYANKQEAASKRAKELHNAQRDGDWNSTMPSYEEALNYKA